MINHSKPLPLTQRDIALLKSKKVEAPSATPVEELAARYVAWAVAHNRPSITLWTTVKGPGVKLRNDVCDEVLRLTRGHDIKLNFIDLESDDLGEETCQD